jgi:hypothetical protein
MGREGVTYKQKIIDLHLQINPMVVELPNWENITMHNSMKVLLYN